MGLQMKTVIFVGIFGLILVGSTLEAKAQRIGIFADPAGTNDFIRDTTPGMVSIYVLIINPTAAMIGVQFSAPIPGCFTGAGHLSDTRMFPVTIGNSQTGVAIAMGACLSSPVHVLTINVMGQGLTDTDTCCQYLVLPDPNVTSGEIEFTNCSNEVVFGTSKPGIVGDGLPKPPLVRDRIPSDGATGQSRDTKLNWVLSLCSFFLGDRWSDVFFGTTPDPPLVAEMMEPPYDPGLLQPSTIYYWKVRGIDTDAGMIVTPVWSFMTQPAVPVESTTWGRVKALYRN